MIRYPNQTRTFGERPEDGQNPFTGFDSFQHFQGEKLYSDIVVLPENGMTETERVECYPVSADAEENGREQGWYPDSSVAYIRILWKEYEPEQGVYNDAFVEDLLAQARAHGQSLIFRLMAHSTRACDDVPEWLKTLIPCPERPDGKRVKDSPTDPKFVELFLKAVEHLGQRFDAEPLFEAIDISLPGAWGEGHRLDLYPDDTLKRIMDTYIRVFPNTQLMAQLEKPDLLDYAWNAAGVRVGWRGDGLGNPQKIQVTYPNAIVRIEDAWKHAPVSFESYWWLGEWQRQGWDLDEIIEKTLSWHISSVNAKSMPIPYEWKEKVEGWIRRMGYHFAIRSFGSPGEALPGDILHMELNVENTGVAPIYHRLPLCVRFTGGEQTYGFETSVDITRWMPGAAEEAWQITLPEDLPAGTYNIEIGIETKDYPMVYFATDAPRNGGYYQMGEIKIG